MTIYTILQYTITDGFLKQCWAKEQGGIWLNYLEHSAAQFWATVENGGLLGEYEVRTPAQANNISGISQVFTEANNEIRRWQNVDTETNDADKTIEIGLTSEPLDQTPKTIEIGLESPPVPAIADPNKTIEIGLTTAPVAIISDPNKTIEIGLRVAPQDGTIGPIFENWIAAFFLRLYQHTKSNKWSNKYNGKWSNRF